MTKLTGLVSDICTLFALAIVACTFFIDFFILLYRFQTSDLEALDTYE